MRIEQVKTALDEQAFLEMPAFIYRGDACYIRPLDVDIKEVFDRNKNALYANGECHRWILVNNRGKAIGRIAAFYNWAIAQAYEQPTGGIGFFECIDDEHAACLLFDTARDWLQQHGMEAMDGPINFGSRERWWGLLVEGWYPPCYGANYNLPYYRRLFENYGFQLYFKQFTFRRSLDFGLDQRLLELARKLTDAKGYVFRHIEKAELNKAPGYFREVYNKAWIRHQGVKPMSEEDVNGLMEALKPVLDVKALWFAFYNGEPVAFFIAIPDVNELLVKHCNGKVNIKAMFYFIWKKKLRLCRTLFGIVFGVVPAHQRKGVEFGLIAAATEVLSSKDNKSGYQQLQMNWIGDFNPKMVNMCKKIGAEVYKTHHTYRYMFDPEQQVQRHALI